ncbi:MAG: hypothetical protein EA339_13430 [Rhodobacteraceae bacterium]|nr:MAG: hypothetical protein EA339_13430 [Paracoccaceae bacterium]
MKGLIMPKLTPIMASEPSAAALLDMPLDVFRDLVEAGAIPPGRHIAPGLVRWDVDQLKRIGRAETCDGMDDVTW